jgi:glycerol uptake facilitator-like aquaporin
MHNVKYIIAICVTAVFVAVIFSAADPSAPVTLVWVIQMGLVIAGLLVVLAITAGLYLEKILSRGPIIITCQGGKKDGKEKSNRQ